MNPTAQINGAHDSSPWLWSIQRRKLIWEQPGAERSPGRGVAAVTPGPGHMRAAMGAPFPAPPGSCHGNDQLPITCMHALPCLRAHSRNALCSQGNVYIPSLAQKGSTPPCQAAPATARQLIEWFSLLCWGQWGGKDKICTISSKFIAGWIKRNQPSGITTFTWASKNQGPPGSPVIPSTGEKHFLHKLLLQSSKMSHIPLLFSPPMTFLAVIHAL